MLRRLVAVMLLIVGVQACSKPIMHTPTVLRQELLQEQKRQMKLASEAKIRKQEEKIKGRIAAEERLLRVAPQISRAGVELCGVLIPADEPCIYNFTLKDNQDDINAFADGKNIVITQAMMNFVKTDEELAVILGHELAHNMLEHTKAKVSNLIAGALFGTILDAVAKTQGINTGAGFSKLGTNIGGLSYSKEFESEADYVGLYITAGAGFSIDNAAQFWRRMSIRNPEAIYIATTHPSNPERFIALSKTEGEIKGKLDVGVSLVPNKKEMIAQNN